MTMVLNSGGATKRKSSTLAPFLLALSINAIAFSIISFHTSYVSCLRTSLAKEASDVLPRIVPASLNGTSSFNSTTPPSRKNNVHSVEFITVGHNRQVRDPTHPATATHRNAFSASWWASTQNFLRYTNVEKVSASPEGASFEFFNQHSETIVMTKDWMDLSVEHLSKWWKIVMDPPWDGKENEVRLEEGSARVLDLLQGYIRRRIPIWLRSDGTEDEEYSNFSTTEIAAENVEVPQSTLAVIAYMPFSPPVQPEELTKWSLAATLSSLVEIGVGRIIVSGRLLEQKELVVEAFNIVEEHFSQFHRKSGDQSIDSVSSSLPVHKTEFNFCLCYDEPTGGKDIGYNIPKSSLKKLRHVMMGNATLDEIECWLGDSSIKANSSDSAGSSGVGKMNNDRGDFADSAKSAATNKIDKTRLPSKGQENQNNSKGEHTAQSHHKSTPKSKSKWDYILLSEPDQLLTTRPSTLIALSEKLKQGYVLAPHRLQPIPHGSDFHNLTFENDAQYVIPAADQFVYVHSFDSKTMSCCDTGSFSPSSIFDKDEDGASGSYWYQGGFWTMRNYQQRETVPSWQEAHKRLLLYPLVRLERGLRVVWAGSESGRMCRPQFGMCAVDNG